MSWEAGVMMTGVGVLWFLGLLIINTDEEHTIMKLFYLIIGMWFMVALINLGLQFAVENSASETIQHSISILYGIVVWVARIVSTYYIFYYFWYLMNMLREHLDKKRFGRL